MFSKCIVLLILYHYVQRVNTARILGIFPAPAYSHHQFGKALLQELSEQGHNVTMISPFQAKNVAFEQITVAELLVRRADHDPKTYAFNVGSTTLFQMYQLYSFGLYQNERFLNHSKIQTLLNSGSTFDLVILDQVMNEAHKYFSYHFNASLIICLLPCRSLWLERAMWQPSSPAYHSDILLGYDAKMTFRQRLINTIFSTVHQLYLEWYVFGKEQKLVEQYFSVSESVATLPQVRDYAHNAVSLALTACHWSIIGAQPTLPNVIDVAGIHINNNSTDEVLSIEVQQFLDASTNGVIYMCLGSIADTAFMGREQREIFVNVFKALNYSVLWRTVQDDDYSVLNQSANVRTVKWAVQQRILAHANVKLFITHGGMSSLTEAIHFGVPLLLVPLFFDQQRNSRLMMDIGVGLMVDLYGGFNETSLKWNILELLENPLYRQAALDRSRIYQDQPMSALNTATYWVNYVLRHKGGAQFRRAALDLPWYQYYLVDVIAMLLVMSIAVFCSGTFLIYYLFNRGRKIKTE